MAESLSPPDLVSCFNIAYYAALQFAFLGIFLGLSSSEAKQKDVSSCDIRLQSDQGEYYICVLIDLNAAVDTVSHNTLLVCQRTGTVGVYLPIYDFASSLYALLVVLLGFLTCRVPTCCCQGTLFIQSSLINPGDIQFLCF